MKNKNINFDSWKTPKLSSQDKQDLMGQIERAGVKPNRFRLVPALAAAVAVLAIGLSFFFIRERSLDHKMSVAKSLLQQEVDRHREYLFFVENMPEEMPDMEERYEERSHN